MIFSRTISSSVVIAAVGMMLSPIGLCQGMGPGTLVGASVMEEIPKLPKDSKEAEGFMKGKTNVAPPRKDILNQIQSAHDLIKANKYPEALAKLQTADASANKTPAETYIIERTRIAIASMTNNEPLLIKSLETVMATDLLSPEERISFSQVLGNTYYEKKDYAKSAMWLARYFKEGGKDAASRSRIARAYYLNNDFALATEEIRADIKATEDAGRTPTEDQLRMLASCALKLKDKEAYAAAIEKFVTYHPKKEYWADLLNHLFSKPGFSDRLSLDIYRLMHATGQLNSANDYVEMAQLAVQYAYAPEGVALIDEGLKSGILGVGPDAAKHKRLRDNAAESAERRLKTIVKEEAQFIKAKDGGALVDIGYFYVVSGQFNKGIGLIEQGIRVGGIKRPDHAKLHLGISYLLAGRKAEAIQAFKTVEGTDGAADLARYWIIHLQQPET